MDKKPLVGISSCLLGNEVRYDGGHKLLPLLKEQLGGLFTFLPLCPEDECGLGTPREPMSLVRTESGIRLIANCSKRDFTESLEQWIDATRKSFKDKNLCGFILKTKSPSCGLGNVKLFNQEGLILSDTFNGLFATALQESCPHLPIVEEGSLLDRARLDAFIEAVFSYQQSYQ